MILASTLAGILTIQPVDKVYLAGSYFAYAVGGVEHDCANALALITGQRADVTAQVCTLGLFRGSFE